MELMSTTLRVGFPDDWQKVSLGAKCSWCGLDGAEVRKISRRHLHAEARQEAHKEGESVVVMRVVDQNSIAGFHQALAGRGRHAGSRG